MKTVIIVLCVFLIVFMSVAIVWLYPVKGEKNDDHWYSRMQYTEDYALKIEKQAGKDFKILAFSDLQMGDTLDLFGLVGTHFDTMKQLVEKDKPDLIILMGDILWSIPTKVSALQIIDFMDSLGIPWAPLQGNHDSEGVVDFNWFADKCINAENCIFKKGPNNIGGVGNFVINVTENDKIVESLIFMDTHRGRAYPELNAAGYDYIYDSQMDWYKWVINGLKEQNKGVNVNSMLFLHIPLPEYIDAYNEWEKSGFDPSIGFGQKNEEPCPSYVNTGMFDLIKELGSTKYVFAAHDHVNNYSVDYQGVRLSYTMKTGDRCNNLPELNGGTRITINSNNEVKIEHDYIKL